MQAVEKGLGVEADMLEDSENRAREALGFKHPRCQGPPNWRAHNFRTDRNMGISEILMQRSINLSKGHESKAEGFPLNTSDMPNSYRGATWMPWCRKLIRDTLKIIVREEVVMFV